MPVSGGNRTTLASGKPGRQLDVAVDDSNVYWTTYLGGDVLKVPMAGGKPTTLGSGFLESANITVDGTSVYWSSLVCGGSSLLKLRPK